MKIAGVDEAGRGPIAGPVFAAAVILNPKKNILNLADSKKLSENKISIISKEIQEKSLSWAVSSSSVKEIESLNILNASLLAMKRAVSLLDIKPSELIIDGKFIFEMDIKMRAVIKADTKFKEVMAASILAKDYRDKYMIKLDKKFPEYYFKNHKGYPTKQHLEAIELEGICVHHRKTFKPILKYL